MKNFDKVIIVFFSFHLSFLFLNASEEEYDVEKLTIYFDDVCSLYVCYKILSEVVLA